MLIVRLVFFIVGTLTLDLQLFIL